MSQQLERGMEGMPRDVRSMKLPRVNKAPREARDVSAKDPSTNKLGNSQGSAQGGKKKSAHPHKRNNLVNSYPWDITENQQRVVEYTEPTSEISVGGKFLNGAGKYLNSRKVRS